MFKESKKPVLFQQSYILQGWRLFPLGTVVKCALDLVRETQVACVLSGLSSLHNRTGASLPNPLSSHPCMQF